MDNNFNNQPTPGPIPNQQPAASTPNFTQPQPTMPNQIITQPATSTSQTSFSIKSIVITAVGALGVISFFLPWLSVSSFGTANGAEIGHDSRWLGWAALILFVSLTTIAATNILRKPSLVHKICISAMGGLAALFSIIMMIIMLSELQGYGSASVGLILSIIAGIASAALVWVPIKE